MLQTADSRCMLLGDAVAALKMEVTLDTVKEALETFQKLGIATIVMRQGQPWLTEAALPLTIEDLKPPSEPRCSPASLEKVKNVSVLFEQSRKTGRANATLHYWQHRKCPAHNTVECKRCYELKGSDSVDRKMLQGFVKFPL